MAVTQKHWQAEGVYRNHLTMAAEVAWEDYEHGRPLPEVVCWLRRECHKAYDRYCETVPKHARDAMS